jgi:hypothetical protein
MPIIHVKAQCKQLPGNKDAILLSASTPVNVLPTTAEQSSRCKTSKRCSATHRLQNENSWKRDVCQQQSCRASAKQTSAQVRGDNCRQHKEVENVVVGIDTAGFEDFPTQVQPVAAAKEDERRPKHRAKALIS